MHNNLSLTYNCRFNCSTCDCNFGHNICIYSLSIFSLKETQPAPLSPEHLLNSGEENILRYRSAFCSEIKFRKY